MWANGVGGSSRITTNLYAQEDFHSADEAFTYHLGVMQVTREQFKTEPDEIHTEYVGRPWRRFRRAVEAMDDAEEAEDYQAVGMRCREALITLGAEYQDAAWVRLPTEHPMASDAKQWLRIYADSLTTGRPRDYLRSLAQRTWEIANWLTHWIAPGSLEAVTSGKVGSHGIQEAASR
jgi:hypothetical protein